MLYQVTKGVCGGGLKLLELSENNLQNLIFNVFSLSKSCFSEGKRRVVFYSSYEGGFTESFTRTISLQILGTGHAAIPHIKAMDVPFHLIYGNLICGKRLQSDRQNKVGCLQTPAGRQNMIIKYLSVGRWS